MGLLETVWPLLLITVALTVALIISGSRAGAGLCAVLGVGACVGWLVGKSLGSGWMGLVIAVLVIILALLAWTVIDKRFRK